MHTVLLRPAKQRVASDAVAASGEGQHGNAVVGESRQTLQSCFERAGDFCFCTLSICGNGPISMRPLFASMN